jgi:5-(carboxyamino)imidazole ribonucleotide synthase
MMTHPLPLTRLGIVGGGQLARMLAPACHAYQVELNILDPLAHSPAAQTANSHIVGDLHDADALAALCDVSDVITFDLEDVGADILVALANQGVRMVPDPATVQLIQNKLEQKRHYRAHGIPTTPFEALDDPQTRHQVERFGFPCVQKAIIGGYDGRGVHVLRSEMDWGQRLTGPSFVEAYVPHATELAVMVATRASGEMVAYDPVEMVVDPDLNLLDYLLAPARVPAEIAREAVQLAQQTVASFGSPGLFGVELFVSEDGELYVNEVAPRAHNSGHHSIESCVTSQFENQLRACLDFPLGQTELRGHALTMNLISADGFEGRPVIEGLEWVNGLPDVHIHLYGKASCRPGRKMGHLTLLGHNHSVLIERAHQIREQLFIRGDQQI